MLSTILGAVLSLAGSLFVAGLYHRRATADLERATKTLADSVGRATETLVDNAGRATETLLKVLEAVGQVAASGGTYSFTLQRDDQGRPTGLIQARVEIADGAVISDRVEATARARAEITDGAVAGDRFEATMRNREERAATEPPGP